MTDRWPNTASPQAFSKSVALDLSFSASTAPRIWTTERLPIHAAITLAHSTRRLPNTIDGACIVAAVGDTRHTFHTIYPALGSKIRSELAYGVGAACSSDKCLVVDAHMRTDVDGLYAAGDVVKGLDQISSAMGQGGIAATAIRNDLADRKLPLR